MLDREEKGMICPYLKRSETKNECGVQITNEYHMDCYGTECPFYVPENNTYSNITVPAYCNRADTDFYMATHK